MKYRYLALASILALSAGCGDAGQNQNADAAQTPPAEATPSDEGTSSELKSTLYDTSLSIEERAAGAVAAMTLEEKAAQMGHFAPAIPRLGIPKYTWWNEGLHGVARAGTATVFPQAIGMAASWDTGRMLETADVISTEFRAKYLDRVDEDGGTEWYRGLTVWSPNINIFRDPRWGRGQETYGEDPVLTGEIANAFIGGLQGDDDTYFTTIATSKHYAVHSGPEQGRHKQNFHPSAYDLEATYFPAFRTTVVDGGVYSMMCAYNAVYDVPACASEFLMDEVARADWGFKGYIVADCGAAANVYRDDSLDYTDTREQAAAASVGGGMDLVCGDYRQNWNMETQAIINSVNEGLLDIALVDQAVQRLFVARLRLGLFDEWSSLPWGEVTAADFDTPEHKAVSLDMARASMVLLKNDGLLPLAEAPGKIAVVGPNADSIDALIGNYYGSPSDPVTIVDGIRARFPDAEVVYAQGVGLIGPAQSPVPDSVFCADEEAPTDGCEQPGLRNEAFDNRRLEGEAETSITPNADKIWDGEEIETSNRWSGWITPTETGTHALRYFSQNGYKVFINGEVVVNEWGVGDAPAQTAGKIEFEAGTSYEIVIEGFHRAARGEHQLVWSTPSADGSDAVAAAEDADLVVFAGGLSARIEGEEMPIDAEGFDGGDRTNIKLPDVQQDLLERIHATGTPTVFVVMSGSALGINWADDNLPAVIQAWYPGGKGGQAVAELIAGDYSPAGRLPVTFYRSVDELPGFLDYSMEGRTYRYFEGEVLYPFGYGLSYSTFAYANAATDAAEVAAGDSVTVSVDVTNTGERDAEEVVQLYVSHPGEKTIRELKAFDRIALSAGETKTVSFTLDERALSIVDAEGKRHVAPGEVAIWVGGGQPTVRDGLHPTAGTSLSVTVTGSKDLPR